MNEDYKSLFKTTVRDFCEKIKIDDKRAAREYVLSYPHVGKNYERGKILVVGRALDGWYFPFLIKDGWLTSFDSNVSFAEHNPETKNLAWAVKEWNDKSPFKENERRISRYRFWQVLKDIVKNVDHSANDENWLFSIAWTNLYKISPNNKKGNGNPDSVERKAQLDNKYVRELLKLEIEILKPRIIIFLTGANWADIILNHLEIPIQNNESIVRHVSKYNESLFIVCERPDSRKKGITNENFVNAVNAVILNYKL